VHVGYNGACSDGLRLLLQIDAHTDTLISEQASVILGHCGLAQLYGIAQQYQPQQVCNCSHFQI